jgi:hypothetical protein
VCTWLPLELHALPDPDHEQEQEEQGYTAPTSSSVVHEAAQALQAVLHELQSADADAQSLLPLLPDAALDVMIAARKSQG